MTFITRDPGPLARRLSIIADWRRRLAEARARATPPTSGETVITLGAEIALHVGRHQRRAGEIVDRDAEEA